jgi:uncharacterized membrane-anchored protein
MALAATIENQSEVDGGWRTRPKFPVASRSVMSARISLSCRAKPSVGIVLGQMDISFFRIRTIVLLLCLLLDGGGVTRGVSGTDDEGSDVEKMEKNLQWRQGEITIGENLAKLNIPPTFRFLGPKDANAVLSALWGNPTEEGSVLGMIFPAAIDPSDRSSWGVVISYEADGHVKDDEAAGINYDGLLKQLRKTIEDQNNRRTTAGYPIIHLIGWAAPPHYNRDTHKLYWAKELSFDNLSANTLNYNIRVLGRRGALVVNVVAPMARYPEVERQMPELIAMVDFTPGNRYADFAPVNDTVAAYGLIALLVGGAASKGGFFKALPAAILARKKRILVGIAALGAFLVRIFRRRKPARSRTSSMARR